MQTSDNGINLIKSFESLSLKAYPDPKTGGKPYTIGWGMTTYPSGMPVKLTDVCTAAQADTYLKHDISRFEADVKKAVRVPLSQCQFDALVSFFYNLGYSKVKDSTLLKMLNAGNYTGAADQFLRWVSPGSSVEKAFAAAGRQNGSCSYHADAL